MHEPGLPELVQRNAKLGACSSRPRPPKRSRGAQVAIIAVGTPSRSDGSADLQCVLEAAARHRARARRFAVVVTKSTVPVGTADQVRARSPATADHEFVVASNPEFLKEGDAVNDFLKPARVIIGAEDPRAIELLRDLYRGVMRTGDRVQVMDLRSAELTKYAANAMLATRISFMNELARLAEVVGADIEAVRKGIGSDLADRREVSLPRRPPGLAGSCFPKDPGALRHTGDQVGGVELDGDRRGRAPRTSVRRRVLGERVIAQLDGLGRWPAKEDRRGGASRSSPRPMTSASRRRSTLIAQPRARPAQITGYDLAAMPNIRAQLGDAIALRA